MASVPSTRALTASIDGSDAGAYFNVDTVNKLVQIPNGAKIRLYSDAYNTQTQEITGSGRTPIVSATSPDPGAGGTIATASVDVALVTPAAARTGIILQAGTFNGQEVTVVNQAASANSLTMAASGTSNVADGTSDVIAGVTARKFVWNSTAALWYRAA